MMRVLFLFNVLLCFSHHLIGQQSNDINQSIISQATFSEDGTLTLSWIPKSNASNYVIQYRTDLDGPWQISATGVTDSFFVFPEMLLEPVELNVFTEDGTFATSYILAGNEFFEADQDERMLLLITDSLYSQLESTIENYRAVLQNEMISTEVVIVNENTPVAEVKDQIVGTNNVETLDYILIIGHVAVPYSGNSAIDGHAPDHEGAWVADGYYGDLDGSWTDFLVDNNAANREETKNIPGDGKFDQSFFPSDIDIPVGRIDFSDLPKLQQTETELSKRYLERNIEYRMGRMKATRRGVIDNNFNLGEGFAQGAIKSFHTFLEPDSINYGNFSQCTSKDYLFTYGAGAGNYQSASGIINTDALVNDSIQSIFTTIFGSYFGDWDVSNNLLRASLARGSSLINAWSGRPIWYFHQMAMGATVADVLLNTQNNNGNYTSQFGKRMCHISLLGDPSLKMYYHEPVSNVVVDEEKVSWEYLADDAEVVGYTVYYKENDKWKLIGDGPIFTTSIDVSEIPSEGLTKILIKPVGLIHSRSGSYYNEGNGTEAEVLIITNTNDLVQSYKLFPNPAQDYLSIATEEKIGNVLIYDIHGRLIQSEYNARTINVSTLPMGVYTMMINDEAIRFVKE